MKKWVTTGSLLAVVGAAALGLVLFPQDVSRAVLDGLTICLQILLPTLFPFLVLSGFLISSGLTAPLSSMMSHIMQPIFHLPGVCASPLLLGWIGGYPTGAKTAVALYQSGQCSREDAERTLAFCNNCGPGFLLGSVGYGIFDSISLGLMLLLCHWLGAVLVGLLLSPSSASAWREPHPRHLKPQQSVSASFVLSVTAAMQSFFNLSAFVLCFSALTCLVRRSGIAGFLSTFLPFTGENRLYFLLGLLEMTAGALRVSSGPLWENMLLTSALIGWGGLSVHCQVLSLLQGTDLSPRLYFRGKFLHCILSALLTACCLRSPLTALCFVVSLLFFSFCRKKAVEKKLSVYYNDAKQGN